MHKKYYSVQEIKLFGTPTSYPDPIFCNIYPPFSKSIITE